MADHILHSVSDCICTTMDPKWAKKTCWRAFTHTELLCDRGKSLIYFHFTLGENIFCRTFRLFEVCIRYSELLNKCAGRITTKDYSYASMLVQQRSCLSEIHGGSPV